MVKEYPNDIDILLIYSNKSSQKEVSKFKKIFMNTISKSISLPIDCLVMSEDELKLSKFVHKTDYCLRVV